MEYIILYKSQKHKRHMHFLVVLVMDDTIVAQSAYECTIVLYNEISHISYNCMLHFAYSIYVVCVRGALWQYVLRET